MNNKLDSEFDDLSPLMDEALKSKITGVACDSRDVNPGDLFVALSGAKTDGRSFISQAIENGAVAILANEDVALPDNLKADIPYFTTKNPRKKLARLATIFQQPQPRNIVAVTGTNGKTSVASFVQQIWQAMNIPSASIGTIGITTHEGTNYGGLTTPDPVTLHGTLKDLREAGIDHIALEASSHGLDQYRLDGISFKAGAWTNISQDHLDYHPSFQHYLEAKLRFFKELLPTGSPVIINQDDGHAEIVEKTARTAGLSILTTGFAGHDIQLNKIAPHLSGQLIEASILGQSYELELPLIGEYQAYNVLTAVGLVYAMGSPLEEILGTLNSLKGVPGRLERVGLKGSASILVDYAHTPDALENAISSIRPFVSNRLIVVFGCGGDRDRGKRPLMGKIAQEQADLAFITDDNPRTENPARIRQEIRIAAPDAKEIGDRKEAIQSAIDEMQSGDVLLIAGKGHEQGQIVGEQVLPFSDQEVVRSYLAEITS